MDISINHFRLSLIHSYASSKFINSFWVIVEVQNNLASYLCIDSFLYDVIY